MEESFFLVTDSPLRALIALLAPFKKIKGSEGGGSGIAKEGRIFA